MAKDIIKINTVEEFCDTFHYPPATHPLIAIFRLTDGNQSVPVGSSIQSNLYSIALKQGVKGMSKYGWRDYDFSKGLMSFFAPGQVLHSDGNVDHSETTGLLVIFHSDFIRKYKLGATITRYKFFSYEANEALHMSDAERIIVEGIITNIRIECERHIDEHSHDIIVSQLEVFLNYADRFYKRQFRTRFSAEADIITRFEIVLHDRFEDGQNNHIAPGDIAAALSMSTNYLSEMLRSLTGMNTQQHIHAYLIEKAKNLLLSTDLSAKEIAYKLGFEYPAYFNRLFKSKTGKTPVEFRNMN